MIKLEKVYDGKTKTVYKLEDGNYLLKFKDDATGADGVFDPGANAVGLTIQGMGNASLRMSRYFFEKMSAKGIPTQYISCDPSQDTMVVKHGTYFGKGLECICRYKAVGSFIRRFGSVAQEGQDLDALVEFTLKDDERQDPPATKDILVALGVVTEQEYETLKKLTRDISNLIKDELATKGLELYDIKLEFGRHGNEIILIDEVSAGNMRVYKQSKSVAPIELAKLVLE